MPASWTLAEMLARRVRDDADRPAVVAGGRGRSITYGQLDARADAFAAALTELGIGAGDRIAVNLPNCPEWVITLVAAAKLGAVVVPVNPRLNYHEFKYQLRHAEVSAAVTAEQYDGMDFLQIFEDVLVELPDLLYLVTVGREELWSDDRIFQFEDLLSSGEGRPVPRPELDDGDDFAVLYTSGTVGKPKGVRLSHQAIVETAVRTGEAIDLDRTDRVLAASVPTTTPKP
jgi:fatty-acyl-CoA synthase